MKAGRRGIQKICDACKNLGAEKEINTLTGNEKKVLQILENNPFATYMEIADRLAVSRKTVSQKIKVLKDQGYIVRIDSTIKDIGKSYNGIETYF